MAAPNLRSPSTITGKTAVFLATTALGAALSNAAASNKLLKVNTVRVANVSGSTATADVTFFRSSTHTYLLKAAAISVNTALVVSDKNEYIYLEEGDALYAKAAADSTLELTINYEEIS